MEAFYEGGAPSHFEPADPLEIPIIAERDRRAVGQDISRHKFSARCRGRDGGASRCMMIYSLTTALRCTSLGPLGWDNELQSKLALALMATAAIVKLSVVHLLAFFLVLVGGLKHVAFYGKRSPVLTLNHDNFQRLITESNYTSVSRQDLPPICQSGLTKPFKLVMYVFAP